MMTGSATQIGALAFDRFAPWTVLSTKSLTNVLAMDPGAFAMRRYRGKGPVELPSHWFHGRVRAYSVVSIRNWLGDTQSETEMFRSALLPILGSEVDDYDEPLVRLFAAAQTRIQCEPFILGARFTAQGEKEYMRFLETGLSSH